MSSVMRPLKFEKNSGSTLEKNNVAEEQKQNFVVVA